MSLAALGVTLALASRPAVSELVLTRASVALEPGQSAHVVIKLIRPKALKSMGTDGHEGQLAAAVRVGRRPWVQTNIGELIRHSDAAWWFADGQWDIVFADYDHDGRLDFNLGGRCGSNNFCYWLFSINKSGRVALLPLPTSTVEPGFLWIQDDANSTTMIELTADGIAASAYDPAEGSGVRVRYRWDATSRSFVAVERTVGKTTGEQAHAP